MNKQEKSKKKMIANVINLKRRTDRREEIKAECERVGLTPVFHDAVDGQSVFRKEGINKRMRGHFGCLQSHRNVLKAVKGNGEFHLILEDDALLCDDFVNSVQEHISKLPTDWSMCYFGGHVNTLPYAVEDYNDDFWYARKVLGTYCYVVKDEHIDEILETLEARLWKADMVMVDYQQKKDVYITKKCHSWCRASFSDIGHDIIDNPNLKY